MKSLFLFLILSNSVLAGEMEVEIPLIFPDSSFVDNSLDSNEVRLSFFFQSDKVPANFIVTYNIDNGETKRFNFEEGPLTMKSTAGQHNLQFFLDEFHHEEYPIINVEGGKHHYFTVYFSSAEMMIIMEKPVIYLYPEKVTDVDVKVNPTGEFAFTYPEYNDGWNVEAHPDGNLYIRENSYNYLFWESQETWSSNLGTETGFVVEGKNATKFLEVQLTKAGLNSHEKMDFITYWAPRMSNYKNVFVQFIFNETCDRHATLDISPKPDNIYRIYMLWNPIYGDFIPPTEQEIVKANRDGFTVIEWGGQELPQKSLPKESASLRTSNVK